MTGYVRNDTANNIADDKVASASDIDGEFDAIVSAFDETSGHKHDGSSAEGAYVPLIADSDANNKVVIDTSNNRVGVFVEVASSPVEQIRIGDGAIVPVTTNDVDLGSSGAKFKDAYIDGVGYIDEVQGDLTGNVTAPSGASEFNDITVNGTFTSAGIGEATFAGDVDVSAADVVITVDDTSGDGSSALDARIRFQSGGITRGTVGFPNTTNGTMQVENQAAGDLRLKAATGQTVKTQINSVTILSVDGSTVNVEGGASLQVGSVDVVTTSGSEILTNKTINIEDNTVTIDGTEEVGFKRTPILSTTGRTLATTDVGKVVSSTGTCTIPNSTFSAGDILTVYNNSGSAITLTCSITTAYIAGINSDEASVSVSSRGFATVFFVSGTECVVSGNVS